MAVWRGGGDAYIGLYTKAGGNTLLNYRETLGTTLIEPLQTGSKYFVSFKVSLADSANCVSNNIGILFSTYPFNPSPTASIDLPNYSHIHSTILITDTAYWQVVSGAFIADSSYTYLALGNFYDDASTDTLLYEGFPSSNFVPAASNHKCWACYYIDDVCVSTDSLECALGTAVHQPVSGVSVFPNPAETFIRVDARDPRTMQCALYDALGRLVLFRTLDGDGLIDVSQVPSAVYTLVITSSSHTVRRKQLIVR